MRPARLFDTELAGRLLGLRAGRARRDGRAAARARAGEGPLGGRLVDPPAARAWLRTPRSTSRCSSSCATCSPPSCSTSRASSSGRGRSSRRCRRRRRRAPRADPWRRTSGMHRVRKPARAGRGPVAVGGPRRAGPASATSPPAGCCPTPRSSRPPGGRPRPTRTLSRCRSSAGGRSGGCTASWFAALSPGRRLAGRRAAPPLPRRATARRRPPLGRPRPGRGRPAGRRPGSAWRRVADEHSLPVENLLPPDLVRRLCWSPPPDADVPAALRKGGARDWQIELLAPLLEPALHP